MGLAVTLCGLLFASAAWGFVPPTSFSSTNAAAQSYRDNLLNRVSQSCSVSAVRIERLEREVARLETESTILAVLFGSSLVSFWLLGARDKLRWQTDFSASGVEARGTSQSKTLVLDP